MNGPEEVTPRPAPPPAESQSPPPPELRLGLSYSEQSTGAFPPPVMLEGYKQLLPDAPERFFALAEAQAANRHDLNRFVVQRTVARQDRGQWMAYSIALIVIIAAIAMIFTDHQGVGVAIVITEATTIGGIFIANVLSQRGYLPPTQDD